MSKQTFKFEEKEFKDLETAFKDFTEDPHSKDKELDYYFDSYSHISIHHEMLDDVIRTKAYQHAILNNEHIFRDKIVLDIGCGTGILSMFAASAGAKHVYAIEMASVYKLARLIIKENNF